MQNSVDLNARIVVVGAGSIGCWVGGALLKAGRNVTFLARHKVIDEVAEHGLTITDFTGRKSHLSPDSVVMTTDVKVLLDADIIIVAVKSLSTSEAACDIAKYAPEGATILSFQNGVKNANRIRAVLGEHTDIRSVMVPFNVVWSGPGHFHRGVGGELVIQKGHTDLADLFTVDGLAAKTVVDIESVLWGKILLNLNNALNALSNIPLKAQLSQRDWRKILATCQSEAFDAMHQACIRPKTELPIPVGLLPTILRLPNFLFERVAANMLAIDENARSSMWEDLTRGRQTEIADLQGAILELAKISNTKAPANKRVYELIKQAEQSNSGSPGLTPKNIL